LGSPTYEFRLKRRLRRGDSLTLLLFFIVTKGLTGLVREGRRKNLYEGLKIGASGSGRTTPICK